MHTFYSSIAKVRYVLLLSVALLMSWQLSAQLNGGSTYTINGTNNYPSTFRTFGGFINFLNTQGTTGSGQIIVEITSSHVDSVIPVLTAYSGMSASRPILFRVASGNTVTISTTATLGTNSFLFRMNGTKYFTIDGSNNGSTSRDLTWLIPSSNGTTSVSILGLAASTDSCVQDTVKNCIFVGGKNGLSNSSAGIYTHSGIYMGSGSVVPGSGTNNNNRNAFINNKIVGVRYGLYLRGSSSGNKNNWCYVYGNTIGANNTWEYVGGNSVAGLSSSSGIFMTGFTYSRIRANQIGYCITSISYGFRGIDLNTTSQFNDNILIDQNNISNIYYTGTGGWGAYGIYVTMGTTTNVNIGIVNNMISGIKADGYSTITSTFTVSGIFLTGTSSAAGILLYHNSISLFGNTLGSSGSSSQGNSTCLYLSSGITGGIDCRNNIFKNIAGRAPGQSTTNKVSAIVHANTSGTVNPFSTLSNNNYYVSASNGANTVYAFFKNADRTGYSDMISSTSESYSQNTNPSFVDSTDLHLSSSYASTPTLLESGGATISGVSIDYDNQSRPGPTSTNGGGTAPDIGADELDMKPVTGIDVGVSALVSPVLSNVGCGNASVTITVRVKNYSTSTAVDCSVDTIPIKVVITGPNAQTFTIKKVSGTLAANATFDTTLTTTYAMTATGTYVIKSFTEYATDGNKNNDTNSTTFSLTKITSFPYVVDFTGAVMPSGWDQTTNISGTAAWNFVSSMTSPTLSPVYSSGMAHFNSYSISDGGKARLQTPCLDLTSLSAPKVDCYFSEDNGYSSDMDSVVLYISTDGGSSWSRLTNGGYQRYNASATTARWTKFSFDLSAYAGQVIKIGFLGISSYGNNIGLDRVKVYDPPAIDMAAFSMTSPTSSFYGTNKTITFRFKNFGSNTIDFSTNNMTVYSSVSGPISATFSNVTVSSGALAPGSTTDVTVSTTCDLSSAGNYTFSYKASVSGDGDNTNDSAGITINVIVPVDYSITRSTGISYSSIMSTGNSLSFAGTSGDDQLSPAKAIGFNFTYQGTTFTKFKVCTNGWMTLDTNSTSTTWTSDIGNNLSSRLAVLAPYWTDLVCTGHQPATPYTSSSQLDQSIKYQLLGTSPNRILVVEWAGMEKYSYPGPNLNFQVRLYEGSNNIEYIYGDMMFFDGTNIAEFAYSTGMTNFSTTGALSTDQVLALQSEQTDIFSSTAVNNLSWAHECNSKYLFTPGTHGSGTARAAITNDSCGAPVSLSVGTDAPTGYCTYYRTENATNSGYTASSGTPDDDVWFTFTLAAPKVVKIDLRSSPSFDGVFEVFSGTCGSFTSLTLQNKTSTSLSEDTNLSLAAGTYYIRVFHSGTGSASTGTAKGNFGIFVYDAPVPPANDNVGGATSISSNVSCVTGTTYKTIYATASGQSSCTGTPSKDVWFKFTAVYASHTLTVAPALPGTSFNPAVQVYNAGSSFDTSTMSQVYCQNASGTNASEVINMTNLVVGNQYAVRVYNAIGGAGGTGNFTICLVNPVGFWSGAVSTVWTLPGNWSNNVVPISSTDARIGVSRPNYPVITSTANMNNFRIDSGASLTLNSGANFNINGTVTVASNGVTYTHNAGYINFAYASNIPAWTYHALKMTAATGTYTLLGNITVNNVFLNTGAAAVNIGSYNIDCKSDMTVNGTYSGTGKVISSRTSGYATITGAPSFYNLELNTSAAGGLRVGGNSLVLGTLTLTQGTLLMSPAVTFTVGATTSATGNIQFGSGSILGGASASTSTFTILGNASAPQITGFIIQTGGNVILDRVNGLIQGAPCNVGGNLTLNNGKWSMNGNNLTVGSNSTATGRVVPGNGLVSNSQNTGVFSILGNGSALISNLVAIDSAYQIVSSVDAGISLGRDVIVSNKFTISKGKVNLYGKDVILGSTASISEAGGKVFFGDSGSITTTRNYASSLSSLNIAGMGLKLTTSAAPGNVTLSRFHTGYTTMSGKNIRRVYSINCGSAVTANYFELNYDSSELDGAFRNYLRLNTSTNNGTTWATISNCTPSTSASLTGYVGKINVSLPGSVIWITASDSNNYPMSPVVTTGVSSNNLKTSVSVYPNPFSDKFTIEMGQQFEVGSRIELFDMNGKKVSLNSSDVVVSGSQISVNTGTLANGMYMLRIIQHKGILTIPMIRN